MGFFQSQPSENEYFTLSEHWNIELSSHKNLQHWWHQVRNKFTPSFFCSHQTRQLDSSIALLSKLIADFTADREKHRREALLKLYSQLHNWQHMHEVNRQKSGRLPQLMFLTNWVESQLYSKNDNGEGQQAFVAARYIQSASLSVKTEEEGPFYANRLYEDWKKVSKLGLFHLRSRATKELDKAIHWFSSSIILDELRGLQELMDAIEVWKEERKDVSRRLAVVQSLEQLISGRMAQLLPQVNGGNNLLRENQNFSQQILLHKQC